MTEAADSYEKGLRSPEEHFEERRRNNALTNRPILGVKLSRYSYSWLDEVDPKDLPYAADEIVLASAARNVIKWTARLENAARLFDAHNQELVPDDLLYLEISRQQQEAVAHYLQTKAFVAKISHLESINRRSQTIPFPKKRTPRLRVKSQETA